MATHWKNCELLKLFATWQPQEHRQFETIHGKTVQALPVVHHTPIIFNYQDSMSFIPCNKLKISKKHTVINYSEELIHKNPPSTTEVHAQKQTIT